MKESSFFHRYKEMILGVLMTALASFYLYHATFIRVRSSVKVTAKLIPEILGVLVLILGVLQIIAGIKYLLNVRAADAAEGNKVTFIGTEERSALLPVILTFATILFYVLTFEWLGFVISSTLCMFMQMLILSPKKYMRPGFFFAISLVVAVVVYIAFRKGLDLSLPSGLLESFGI